jgi:hypothetical protein
MLKISRLVLLFILFISHLAADTPSFASWNFVLWDYADEVTNVKTAQTHWSNLIAFAQKNNLRRVITMIKDPSQFPFFDINQQKGNQYFIYWAQTFAKTVPNCDLCVFFDLTAFTNPKLTPAMPTDLPDPFLKLDSTTFLNLPDKMSWVLAMAQLGAPIKEVDLDPECDPVGPGVGGGMGAKQLLINYMNYFRNQNASLKNVRLGLCLGFDVKSLTFVNLSNLPLPNAADEYNLDNLLPADDNYYNFPTKIAPGNWWGSSSSRPLLDSVYIEAYDNTTPYNFTLQNNPALAAENMLHLYRDEPYMPGTGTITVNTKSKQVTGIGTQFVTQGVTDGTPFGVTQGSSGTIAGRVNGSNPITATQATFYSTSQVNGTSVPYLISESPVKWTFPSIDPNYNPQLLNNICFMFSIEPKYFGGWTLSNFLLFMTNFYNFGQSALPIYTKAMNDTQTIYVPLPNNFGIYDFRQLQINPNYSSLFPSK